MKETRIRIGEMNREELLNSLPFVIKVFNEYEAPDYTEEGMQEFYKSIHNDEYINMLHMYGAYDKDKLIGVIATRSEGTHIALFFVDGEYQRQGIGKQLFLTVKRECQSNKMTVNSSPYGIPVYHKFGFFDTDTEQVVNGLKFTPMELKLW